MTDALAECPCDNRLIIAQLQRNGRTPFRALATQFGVSEATVQRRPQQMIDAGYFNIIVVVDPLRWRQGQVALVGINAEPAAIDSILRAVGEIPQMLFVSLVTGASICPLDVRDVARNEHPSSVPYPVGAGPTRAPSCPGRR